MRTISGTKKLHSVIVNIINATFTTNNYINDINDISSTFININLIPKHTCPSELHKDKLIHL